MNKVKHIEGHFMGDPKFNVNKKSKVNTMNKEQFTPGPWAITRGAGNDKMFFIESRPERGQYWQQIFEGEIYNGEANANLIAAAPDMYEALKDLLKLHRNAIEDGSPEYGIISRAKAVVSKINPDYGKD